MRPRELGLAAAIRTGLLDFEACIQPLPGIAAATARDTLLVQLVESVRRVRYVSAVAARPIHPSRVDPASSMFDPIRAAIVYKHNGDLDESCWLVFLSVHFGRDRRSGWRLLQDVYGGFASHRVWSWTRVARSPAGICSWLVANEATLQGSDGIARRFGSHRKYESLSTSANRSLCKVITSYIQWIGPSNSHQQVFSNAILTSGGNPLLAFRYLFNSMGSVLSFGRTARFDYLSMIGKVGIADIEPDSPYLPNSTGPLRGARLLFGSAQSATLPPHALDTKVTTLARYLGVGLQVMEDALCNWQKSPHKFVPFRG